MIKVLLIYLLIGVVIMFLLEIFFFFFETELESESELELNMVLRLEVILLWPILVIAVILSLLGNDGENSNRPRYTS